jgi:excisionase family DNA binding protein
VSTANQAIRQERTAEPRRLRGNWNVSPLWEAKILLGVLRQQGLAGKGLVQAFEKWAPTIVGSSRDDINRMYGEQTGRDMSDYILVQQADKVVRYNQLPLEAEVFRQALAKSAAPQSSDRNRRERGASTSVPSAGEAEAPVCKGRFSIRRRLDMSQAEASMYAAGAEQSGTAFSLEGAMADKNTALRGSKQNLLGAHPPNVLLTTNELADLTGFAPKTIRRWVSRRLLNYIRVGNRFRFRPAALELFLVQREVRK